VKKDVNNTKRILPTLVLSGARPPERTTSLTPNLNEWVAACGKKFA
jgi:hypothetical protein